jgi:hypothetical protein
MATETEDTRHIEAFGEVWCKSRVYVEKGKRHCGHCASPVQPALRASREGAPAPEWQPIETAPKDGTRVLLGNAGSEDRNAEVACGYWQEAEADGVDYMGSDAGFVDIEFNVYQPGRSFGSPSSRFDPAQPTHWQPLPAPPASSPTEGKP